MQTFHLSRRDRERIGNRVRAARYVAGLTIRMVAEELHVTAHAVHKWEHGAIPEPDRRTAYAELVGVPETRLWAEYLALTENARAVLEA